VFWENMPLRRRNRPAGPDMPLNRALDWGDLAQIQLIDDRQHRDRRTCDAIAEEKLIPDCPDRSDPARSLLGRPQEKWLTETLKASRARWNLLGQQTLMGEYKLDDGRFSNDGWDGYAQTRRRVLETWRDARVSNPVSLGGDVHVFFAGDLELERGKPIASEFVGGSIASLGRDNLTLAKRLVTNPHLKFAEGEKRGYGLVEVTPRTCAVTFRAVENSAVRASPVRDLARFVVEAGEPGLKRA
jgi:alkaline phosphatase D